MTTAASLQGRAITPMTTATKTRTMHRRPGREPPNYWPVRSFNNEVSTNRVGLASKALAGTCSYHRPTFSMQQARCLTFHWFSNSWSRHWCSMRPQHNGIQDVLMIIVDFEVSSGLSKSSAPSSKYVFHFSDIQLLESRPLLSYLSDTHHIRYT